MTSLRDFIGPIGSAIGVNLNAVGDTPVVLPNGARRYIITDIVVTNASVSLGASAATLGAFTLPAGGGTAIVTPAVLTTLTTAPTFNRRTIANTVTLNDGTIQIRVGVVHGTAATCDVYVYGYALVSS
jgi:hypothetical protein